LSTVTTHDDLVVAAGHIVTQPAGWGCSMT
jgi:hypothetical protein